MTVLENMKNSPAIRAGASEFIALADVPIVSEGSESHVCDICCIHKGLLDFTQFRMFPGLVRPLPFFPGKTAGVRMGARFVMSSCSGCEPGETRINPTTSCW